MSVRAYVSECTGVRAYVRARERMRCCCSYCYNCTAVWVVATSLVPRATNLAMRVMTKPESLPTSQCCLSPSTAHRQAGGSTIRNMFRKYAMACHYKWLCLIQCDNEKSFLHKKTRSVDCRIKDTVDEHGYKILNLKPAAYHTIKKYGTVWIHTVLSVKVDKCSC